MRMVTVRCSYNDESVLELGDLVEGKTYPRITDEKMMIE